MIINGATQGQYGWVINEQGRGKVDSISFGRSEEEAELGNAYNINTGLLTLTTANKSAVLYFKSEEDFPVVITSMFYLLGTSTSGTGETLVSVLRNPTTGTIVSGASPAEMAGVNRNFGSNKSLSSDTLVYKGAEGNTFTDGTKVIESYLSVPKREILNIGDIILTKGSSIGIEITPPASNQSLKCEFAMSIFIDTLTDVVSI